MKTKERVEEYLNEDVIGKLYNNDLYLSQILPNNKEYIKLTKNNIKLAKYILENLEGKAKKSFMQYMEQTNIKEGIEAEEQFKLGFKTAIKLILEGLEWSF